MSGVTIDRTNKCVVMTIDAFLDVASIRLTETEIVADINDTMGIPRHFDLLVVLDGSGPASREVGGHMDAMLREIAASGLR